MVCAVIGIVADAGATAGSRIYTVAGLPLPSGALPQGGYGGDGHLATQAELSGPVDLVATADGGFLFSDVGNGRVRRVGPHGRITTVAGGGTREPNTPHEKATDVRLRFPLGVALLPGGAFVVVDHDAHRVVRVSSSGAISVLAGSGPAGFAGDGGPAAAARLRSPSGIVRTPDGALLLADTGNQRIRRIEPNGSIHTVAGTGRFGYGGDGALATDASFAAPTGVALDAEGRILVADSENDRIRRIDRHGVVRTVAGSGRRGLGGDGGPAIFARLYEPFAAIARGAQILIADAGNNRLRKVGKRSKVSTLAGFGSVGGFGGDGGLARRARLRTPSAIALDPLGGVIFADTDNDVVRFIAAPHTRRLALAMTPFARAEARCQGVHFSYRATRSGMLTLTVRHGGTRRRLIRAAREGRHEIGFKRLPPGTYHVRLVARSPDGQTASRLSELEVRKRSSLCGHG